MNVQIRKGQPWSVELPDRAGAAAATLDVLTRAGVAPTLLFTRLHPRKHNVPVLYLAPIVGPDQTRAAQDAGLAPASDVALLVVEGINHAPLAYEIMSRLAVATLPVLCLAVVPDGDRLVASIAFESQDAAALALQVLATLV